MSGEPGFLPIEEKLQAEAQRLLLTDGQPSSARLWSEYRRRQRRRIVQKCAITTFALLAAVSAGAKFGRWGVMPDAQQRLAGGPVIASVPGQPQARTQHGTAKSAGGAQPSLVTLSEDGHAVIAIPFVIGDPAGGEQLITGFYVPEQIEPIDLSKLSPAERDAVQTMLGIESDPAGATTDSKTI